MVRVQHFTNNAEWSLRDIVLNDNKWQFKPNGALYTSPVDSIYGWKDWCDENEYSRGKLRVVMEVLEIGIVVIDSIDDLEKLAWERDENAPTLKHINWPKMHADGANAIWLTAKGEMETRWCDPYRNLYGWDCETLAILDRKIISRWTMEG